MDELLKDLQALPYADLIMVFGSVARGKENPGDIDLYIDVRGQDWGKHPARVDLLYLAKKYPGLLDPFLMTNRGLLTVNESATGWIQARNQVKMMKNMKAQGVSVSSVVLFNKLAAKKPYGVKSATGNTGTFDIKDNRITAANKTAPAHTPAFNTWFSGSKVVDESGNPLPVYHGTVNGGFTEFKLPDYFTTLMSAQGAGFYFTDKANAKQYMRDGDGHRGRKPQLYCAYLSIKNPLEISRQSHNISKEQFQSILSKGNREWFFTDWMAFELSTPQKSKEEFQKLSREELLSTYATEVYNWSLKSDGDSRLLSEMTRAFVGDSIITAMESELGKDGVIWTDSHGKIYVAWHPNQIKLVDTHGEFDPNSYNITATPHDQETFPDGSADFFEPVENPHSVQAASQVERGDYWVSPAGKFEVAKGGHYNYALAHGFDGYEGALDAGWIRVSVGYSSAMVETSKADAGTLKAVKKCINSLPSSVLGETLIRLGTGDSFQTMEWDNTAQSLVRPWNGVTYKRQASERALREGYALPARPSIVNDKAIKWLWSEQTGPVLFRWKPEGVGERGFNTLHSEAMEDLGLPSYGRGYDAAVRGTAELNKPTKSIRITSYIGGEDLPALVRMIRRVYRLSADWKVEYHQLESKMIQGSLNTADSCYLLTPKGNFSAEGLHGHEALYLQAGYTEYDEAKAAGCVRAILQDLGNGGEYEAHLFLQLSDLRLAGELALRFIDKIRPDLVSVDINPIAIGSKLKYEYSVKRGTAVNFIKANCTNDQAVSKRIQGSAEVRPTKAVLKQIEKELRELRAEEGEGQCATMSEILSMKFGWGIAGGFYRKTDQPGHAGHGDHVWNVLKNGTIVDGTHDQFGFPDILVTKPGTPEYAHYHAFCGRLDCPDCTCKICNPDMWEEAQKAKKASLAEPITQTSAFRAWFAGSKIVDDHGIGDITKTASTDIEYRYTLLDSKDEKLCAKVEALQGNNVIGFVKITEQDNEVFVERVHVDESYRRKGIALNMYKRIQQEFPGERIASGGSLGKEFRTGLMNKGVLASDTLSNMLLPEYIDKVISTASIPTATGMNAVASMALNKALFEGTATYIVAYNKEMLTNPGASFSGRVALKYGDEYWDADGKVNSDDLAWGDGVSVEETTEDVLRQHIPFELEMLPAFEHRVRVAMGKVEKEKQKASKHLCADDSKLASKTAKPKRVPLKIQPEVIYHVTKAKNEQSIRGHGMDSTRSEERWNPADGKGFYAFTEYTDAVNYLTETVLPAVMSSTDSGETFQIWKIKPTCKVLADDSFFTDEDAWEHDVNNTSAVFHPKPVPPANCELIAVYDGNTEEWLQQNHFKYAASDDEPKSFRDWLGNVKTDPGLTEIWDDRARGVEKDKGEFKTAAPRNREYDAALAYVKETYPELFSPELKSIDLVPSSTIRGADGLYFPRTRTIQVPNRRECATWFVEIIVHELTHFQRDINGKDKGKPTGYFESEALEAGLAAMHRAFKEKWHGGWAFEPKYGSHKTSALEQWFGASKVVDDTGAPLVVYHGSKKSWISSFDLSMEGTGVVSGGSKKQGVIWFTSEEGNAHFYTDLPEEKKEASSDSITVYGENPFYAAVSDIDGDDFLFTVGPYPTEEQAEKEAEQQVVLYNKELDHNTNVQAVYLKIVKPHVIDGIIPREKEFQEARRQGCDGVIAHGVADGCEFGTVYCVFNPNQIKSASRNGGNFDPNDHSITAATTAIEPVAITDSPMFKSWFSGSKIVNSDGSPKVVYHGTAANFDTFEQRDGVVSCIFGSEPVQRTGFFFSDNAGFSSGFADLDQKRVGANVMPVYLSIKNPADFGQCGWPSDEPIKSLVDMGWNYKWFFSVEPWEMFDGEDGAKLVADLKKLGYDGAIISESLEGENSVDYIAFTPHQIKSAIGNSGGFDPSNPNITASKTASVQKYFHCSRADNCDSIEEKGLLPNMMQEHTVSDGGIYLLSDFDNAVAWAEDEMLPFVGTTDIFEVTLPDNVIPLKDDHDDLNGWGSYVVYDPIPASNVKHLTRLRPDFDKTAHQEIEMDKGDDGNTPKKTAALNNLEGMGMFIIEQAVIPGYEIYLVGSKDDPDWMELAFQQIGQDSSDYEQRKVKVPAKSIPRKELAYVLRKWLQKYPKIHVMSHNPEYLAGYVRILQRAGFKVGEENELVEGLKAFYITGRSLKTAMPPLPNSMHSETFYHGTSGQVRVNSILRDGLQPDKPSEYRGQWKPQKGRVYLTRKIGEAIHYAYTALKNGDEFGYVFAFSGKQLERDLTPDEDIVGRAGVWLTVYGDPGTLLRGMGLKSVPEGFLEFVRNINDKTPLPHASGPAGKLLLESMPEEMKREWLHLSDNVAHQGAVMPYACWRINRKFMTEVPWKELEENFFNFAEEVPLLSKKTAAIESNGQAFVDSQKTAANIENGYDTWQDDLVNNPKFQAWFSGSKVTDSHGRPLRVFHGTFNSFDKFDTNEGTSEGAAFFTPDPEIASSFADAEEFGLDPEEANGNVMPVYLCLKNPMVVEAEDVMSDGIHSFDAMREVVNKARRQGYDGLHILDVPDGSKRSDQFAAFRPNQIKSAIGNSGKFNPKKHNITAAREMKPITIEFHDQVEGYGRAYERNISKEAALEWMYTGVRPGFDKSSAKTATDVGPVYHGSKVRGLTEFDLSKIKSGVGFWFTSDRAAAEDFRYSIDSKGRQIKGDLITAYLTIRNPARTVKEYHRGVNEAGVAYDAYVPEGHNTYVVFDPSQIKIVKTANASKTAAALRLTSDGDRDKIEIQELYHVTRYRSAINILDHDYFRPSGGTIGVSGLSTTTDPNYWWGSHEVRFVLDAKRLAQKYKLRQVDEKLFMNDGANCQESEVKVLCDSAITSAKTFIKRIEFFKNPSPYFDQFIAVAEASGLILKELDKHSFSTLDSFDKQGACNTLKDGAWVAPEQSKAAFVNVTQEEDRLIATAKGGHAEGVLADADFLSQYLEEESPFDDVLFIETVEIEPAVRKQGIGALLVKSLVAKAKKLGAQACFLNASSPGQQIPPEGLLSFYQKLGFTTYKDTVLYLTFGVGKTAALKTAMNITVPESEETHFWEEPAEGMEEFWAFRWPVRALVGDRIIFNLRKKPIAEAVISRIEKPGQHECSTTGRFKNMWKVYWTNESFKRMEPKIASTSPTYYHVTPHRRTSKILREGLVTGKKSQWQNRLMQNLGDRDKVYLMNHLDGAIRWASKMEWNMKTKIDILKIEMDIPDIEPDMNLEAQMNKINGKHVWMMTSTPIPPEAIKQVIPLTDEMKQDFVKRQNKTASVTTTYPLADPVVGGLKVRREVPNMSSISASLTDYTVLPDVRVVSMAELTYQPPYSVSEAKRTEALAEEIKNSKEINPLIVVRDVEGLYILEGGHRFDALHQLGIPEFPAIVVIDEDGLDAANVAPEKLKLIGKQAGKSATIASMYTAYTLTEPSRTKLLQAMPPKFPDVIAHHATVQFGVPKTAEVPAPAKLQVVGYASDESLEAAVVSVDGSTKRPDGSTYHITISLDRSLGRKPVQSNDVVKAGWTSVTPFDIDTIPQKLN